MNGTERVGLTLFEWLMKPGAVRAAEALLAVRVTGLAAAEETSKGGGSIRRSCQFISRGGHALTGAPTETATRLPMLTS